MVCNFLFSFLDLSLIFFPFQVHNYYIVYGGFGVGKPDLLIILFSIETKRISKCQRFRTEGLVRLISLAQPYHGLCSERLAGRNPLWATNVEVYFVVLFYDKLQNMEQFLRQETVAKSPLVRVINKNKTL